MYHMFFLVFPKLPQDICAIVDCLKPKGIELCPKVCNEGKAVLRILNSLHKFSNIYYLPQTKFLTNNMTFSST